MILLGFSFVFAGINCGPIDFGSIVEMDSDNLITRNTTQITLETAAIETNTQSNTILILSTKSHLNKPMTIDFGGNNRLYRNEFNLNIQEMWTMI